MHQKNYASNEFTNINIYFFYI